MIDFKVQYKRFFETKNAFMLVEDVIVADEFFVNDAGVLSFAKDSGGVTAAFFALPPGFWFIVEPANGPARVESPSLIVQ